MEVIEIPLRSFIATAMPPMYAAYNKGMKTELIYIMQKYAGLLTLALIPVCIGAVLFADYAVYVINGTWDVQAANVLRFFMTFSLLFPADRFITLGLDAIHKPNINFLKILAMLVVNIATDYGGIAIFGNIYGVAIATVCPIIVAVWIGYLSLKRYEPFRLIQIPVIGYTELKILLREKLHLKRNFLP